MPAFVIMLALTLSSSFGNVAPKGCGWETRHVPKCAAYGAWLRSGPHPRGEKFVWNGSEALPEVEP